MRFPTFWASNLVNSIFNIHYQKQQIWKSSRSELQRYPGYNEPIVSLPRKRIRQSTKYETVILAATEATGGTAVSLLEILTAVLSNIFISDGKYAQMNWWESFKSSSLKNLQENRPGLKIPQMNKAGIVA